MALDVGAVTIDYSVARPTGAAYRFAYELKEYEGYEGEYWKVSAAWNDFLELDRDTMVSHARGYIDKNGLADTEANEVMRWVTGLPWKNERVMLHLGRH